ncbi:hypothetical protein PILCRDRAFT_788257 [Piloderma croceum F 1598]|uniref:Non-specific serine/threonine protein kinase n=1 Tax=Piloderma croceum (strain F 1598) TaxID=765440 RepID=A0A0C3BUP4_PILCF|nr:hypothetical protein PILCRDRAFT_788257 [Piloderma croceum F 1598]
MLIISIRDDLESLAYTFLFLLKGSLPWQAHSEHGSDLGRIAQVREQKRKLTGPRLAEYSLPEFGRLVEYARGLKFTGRINYAHLRTQFASIYEKHVTPLEWRGYISAFLGPTILTVSVLVHATISFRAPSAQCPVEIDHLISLQIVTRVSIEGYSLQGLADPWHDPSVSSMHWPTSVRPVIVIDTIFDETSSLFKI